KGVRKDACANGSEVSCSSSIVCFRFGSPRRYPMLLDFVRGNLGIRSALNLSERPRSCLHLRALTGFFRLPATSSLCDHAPPVIHEGVEAGSLLYESSTRTLPSLPWSQVQYPF